MMQGFLPVEAVVLEVEVWGFGGSTAKEKQDAYKKRETLFNEQRRKVGHLTMLMIKVLSLGGMGGFSAPSHPFL